MDIENNPIYQAALEYQKMGYSVIPVHFETKNPYFAWKGFQGKCATPDQIKKWWTTWPRASVAVITGKISGIVVVDVEAGGDISYLPDTVRSRTGGGGWHYFFRFDENDPVKNAGRIRDLTDIRGEGGYIIMAPSNHKSGGVYEWIKKPGDIELAKFPSKFFQEAKKEKSGSKKTKKKTDWVEFIEKENHEGCRNDKAAKYAGKLLNDLSENQWEKEGWTELLRWNNEKNHPPLEVDELRGVWDSIAKIENKNEDDSGKKSQADKLLELVFSNPNIVFFRDQLDRIYVQFPVKDHLEIRFCRSATFKRWLSALFWDHYEKAPNKDAIGNALNVIEGRSHAEGEQINLFNRVALLEYSELWYDLADKNWRAVKVTESGWEIIHKTPILFRREAHQKETVEPISGGDIKEFLNFVNVQGKDQEILMLVWLVSAFIPGFPHPIPVFFGAQGSAKSTTCKLLRKLVDPSKVEVLGFPNAITELVQQLSHHWCPVYDNASQIPEKISDELCKVVTGGGFSKRELYSDDDDIIYQMQRSLIINGISLVATKPDLLERSIMFKLDRVPREKRRTEKRLYSEFKQALPHIMGGIFDILVKVLKIVPTIEVEDPSRMADFCIWGSAAAKVLGYTQEEFLEAYDNNLEMQNFEVLASDPVSRTLIVLMDDRSEWMGEPEHLLKDLKVIAEQLSIDPSDKSFPKNGQWLTKRLNKLETNLSEIGIKLNRDEGLRRIITIRKTQKNSVSSVKPEQQGFTFDDKDDKKQDFEEDDAPNRKKKEAKKDKYGTVIGEYPGFSSNS